MTQFFGAIISAFILTLMVQQVFPDGRFPARTTLLVMALSALAAGLTRVYFADSTIFTPEFVGAGLTAVVLFAILHRTGWLAQEPEKRDKSEE